MKKDTLPPLGSHMSIAGGVDRAPARAASVGCTAMQIFVKNNNRWEGPPITGEQARRFPEELAAAGLRLEHVFAHTGYLINLASPKEDVARKSIAALEDELRRCQQLHLPGIVLHPGAHLGTGRDAAIETIAKRAHRIFSRLPDGPTRLLLETTAGTGTNLGGPFEDLRDLLAAIDLPGRMGVCLDTCHIFAAGYDIRTPEAYRKTMTQFGRIVGFKNLRAVHLNDSKHPLGSHKDRHEHIGQGHLGGEAFRSLLTDRRMRKVPMSLETEKDKEMTEDRINLERLRRLARRNAR